MKTLTAHSEIGKIDSICIKVAKDAFISEEHLEKYWEVLNYTEKPILIEAVEEYNKFESILKNYCGQLLSLPENNAVNMDSIYCRDSSIVTNAGVVICNMGKDKRKCEPQALKETLEKNGIKILGTIQSPGKLEGGDVVWLNEYTLAVGQTYRTNYEGIRQLEILLSALQVAVIRVPLPHYRGPSDVFHLMSILSPVDRDLVVLYSPLMPIVFREYLLKNNIRFVEVPDEEFETMGCNVLALEPGVCLMVDGSPITKSLLEKAGCKVITYKGNEISVKGGGGPTCLTRPLLREI